MMENVLIDEQEPLYRLQLILFTETYLNNNIRYK